ncbi:MAG: beta-lactamase family protein [Acidobacteria bacterium]|nr:beta-lactamase family protein [Acidobacteriota bacterium]MYF15761.1 beta-lactamase family protein [Acidobacteriota bacterium]MYI95940.1 beta-lactamase family protein [Acidobacteriota bacterium]
MRVNGDDPAYRLALSATALTAILGGACTVAPPQDDSSGLDPDRLARLDAVLEDYVASGVLPGAVALVAGPEEILYLKAFGYRDREADDPLETDDIFRIASQTKAIVSVAIMILQEDGRLLISDPVGRHLPEYLETTVATANPDGTYDVVPARQPITIRHLLTHTAGITYGGGTATKEWIEADMTGWYFAHREEPIRETVRRMASLPFEAHPGDYWVYGYATDILGAVVEVASGMPLDEFLRTRIFEPLGMADTHFYLPPGKRDRLTVVYSAGEGGFTRAPDPGGMVGQGAYVDGPRTSFSGGAGLLSTASDYGRFLQMLLNGGRLGGARILSPKSVELMTVDHLGGLLVRDLNDASAVFGAERGVGFGLGFRVVEDVGAHGVPGSEGLYGWGGAYHSSYWVDPQEELVVVYLAQLIPSGGLDDHAKFRALVYQAIDAGN